jgi:iron(III) transport system substrate-binding protein
MKILKISTILSLILLSSVVVANDQIVSVYSSRNEELIRPVFEAFTKKTGIKVIHSTNEDAAIIQKLKAEGKTTPADLIITVDAGNLWHAAREDLLTPISSTTLDHNIPAHLRDPGHKWFGMSVRARTIVYNKDKIKSADLTTYEDLADPKWKGKLCLRTSKKVYNQSLVAMLIAEHGHDKAQSIVKGWVGNLATDVFSNDTLVLKAIAEGKCQVGIVNTYYYGRLLRESPNLPLALFWPNQKNTGVHVNVSGAGITKFAKHPENAKALLEWMSTPEAQNLFADVNLEYPANPEVQAAEEVGRWGTFKPSTMNLSQAGALQSEAIKLMDVVGYR